MGYVHRDPDVRRDMMNALTQQLRGKSLTQEEAWYLINTIVHYVPGGLDDLRRV